MLPQQIASDQLSRVTFSLRLPETLNVCAGGRPVLVGSVAPLGSWKLGDALVGERYENLWSVAVPMMNKSKDFFFSWVLVDSEGNAMLGRFGHHRVRLESPQAEVWSAWGTPSTRLQYISESGGSFVRFILQYSDSKNCVPAVIGSIPELGNWSMDRVVMTAPLTNIWIAQANVTPESSIFYNWVVLDADGRCKGRDLGELRYLQAGLSDLQVEVTWGETEQTVRWAALPEPPVTPGRRVRAVFPSAVTPMAPTSLPANTRAATQRPAPFSSSILKQRPSVLMEVAEEDEDDKDSELEESEEDERENDEVGAPRSPEQIFDSLTCAYRKPLGIVGKRVKAKQSVTDLVKDASDSVLNITEGDDSSRISSSDDENDENALSQDDTKSPLEEEERRDSYGTFIPTHEPSTYPVITQSNQQLVLDPEYLRVTYGTSYDENVTAGETGKMMLSDQELYGRWESMLDFDDYGFLNMWALNDVAESGETSRSVSPSHKSEPDQMVELSLEAEDTTLEKSVVQVESRKMKSDKRENDATEKSDKTEKKDIDDENTESSKTVSDKPERKMWSWSRRGRSSLSSAETPTAEKSVTARESKEKKILPSTKRDDACPDDQKAPTQPVETTTSQPSDPQSEKSADFDEEHMEIDLRNSKAETMCVDRDSGSELLPPSRCAYMPSRWQSDSIVYGASAARESIVRPNRFNSEPLPRASIRDPEELLAICTDRRKPFSVNAEELFTPHFLRHSISLDAVSKKAFEGRTRSCDDILEEKTKPTVPKFGVYVHQYVQKVIQQAAQLLNTQLLAATDHESGRKVHPLAEISNVSLTKYGSFLKGRNPYLTPYRSKVVSSACELADVTSIQAAKAEDCVRQIRNYSDIVMSTLSTGLMTAPVYTMGPHASPEQTDLTFLQASNSKCTLASVPPITVEQK